MANTEATLERLLCGCRVGNDVKDGKKRFIIQPCSLDCETYLYAVRRSEEQDKPIRYVIE